LNQYLAEIPLVVSRRGVALKTRLQPIGIFPTEEEAKFAVEQNAIAQDAIGEFGLVTELELGKEYSEGIGAAEHWHYVADGEDKGWH
jgi:hypothetical protein